MRTALGCQKNGSRAADDPADFVRAEPVNKSTITPLVCRDQDLPLSLENSILPARPARQMTLEPGAAIKRGLEIVTASIIGVAS